MGSFRTPVQSTQSHFHPGSWCQTRTPVSSDNRDFFNSFLPTSFTHPTPSTPHRVGGSSTIRAVLRAWSPAKNGKQGEVMPGARCPLHGAGPPVDAAQALVRG